MTTHNTPDGGSSGGGRLPFNPSHLGITHEHVGAGFRAMKSELKSIRSADRHNRSRSSDRYILLYELIDILSDIVSAGSTGFDASECDLTKDHYDAAVWFSDSEADAVTNSWAHGGSRSPNDRERLREVVEFVRAVLGIEDDR